MIPRQIPLKRLPERPLIASPIEAVALLFALALGTLGLWKAIEIISSWGHP